MLRWIDFYGRPRLLSPLNTSPLSSLNHTQTVKPGQRPAIPPALQKARKRMLLSDDKADPEQLFLSPGAERDPRDRRCMGCSGAAEEQQQQKK